VKEKKKKKRDRVRQGEREREKENNLLEIISKYYNGHRISER
jgi:hypothetical protein